MGGVLSDVKFETSHNSTNQSIVAIDVGPKDPQNPPHIQYKAWDDDESPYIPYSNKSQNVDEIPTPSTVQPSQGSIDKQNNVISAHIMAHRRDDSTRVRNPRLIAIEKVLLLNAYPLLYIILLLPGLVNRLVEASGHSSQVVQVMQSTTQFVGLANAFTFGWNEEVARQLKNRFGKK
jgi:hypothetical protein